MSKALELLEEFNKYFVSGNSVPMNASVKVSTSEWEELYSAILSEFGHASPQKEKLSFDEDVEPQSVMNFDYLKSLYINQCEDDKDVIQVDFDISTANGYWEISAIYRNRVHESVNKGEYIDSLSKSVYGIDLSGNHNVINIGVDEHSGQAYTNIEVSDINKRYGVSEIRVIRTEMGKYYIDEAYTDYAIKSIISEHGDLIIWERRDG